MEENTNTMELEQTSDGFMEGWDEEPVTAEADQPEAVAEEVHQPETEEPADGSAAAAEDPTEGRLAADVQESAPAAPAADAPKVWNLRYMDEVRQVGEADMVTLAQKGLDYDRIRTRYDESKPVMELVGGFAQRSGMSIPDYVAHIRTQAKLAQGLSEPEARREVELEDREAVVAAAEAQRMAQERVQQSAAAAQQRENERRMADIRRFQEKYPDVARDPQSIPQEVWESVRRGLSLVESYQDWRLSQAEVARAEAEQKAASRAQNQSNAERATGSMRSAGEDLPSRDPFLEGWNS